jgi:hypothetical protein
VWLASSWHHRGRSDTANALNQPVEPQALGADLKLRCCVPQYFLDAEPPLAVDGSGCLLAVHGDDEQNRN